MKPQSSRIAVKGCAAFHAAAACAGISAATSHAWMARGRAERERIEAAQHQLEQLPQRPRTPAARKARAAAQRAAAPIPSELPFMEFVDRIEQADGEAQVRSAALIANGSTEWRAAAWLLQRRDAASFGSPKHRGAVDGSNGTAPAPAPSDEPRDLILDKAKSDATREFLRAIHEADREAEHRHAAA